MESYFMWLLLLVTVLFIFAYKRLTKDADAITGKYETEIKINGNPEEILRCIKEALNNSGFKRIGHNKEKNRFYSQTKFSMSSFSEYIEVTYIFNQVSLDLKFKSICALPTQIVAWGKNKRNFKKFKKELEKLMPE